MYLVLVRPCLGHFFLIVPTFLSSIFHTTLFFIILVSVFFLLHPCCFRAQGILCGIHTSCMGAPVPIVHAKWSFASRFSVLCNVFIATKDGFKPTI